MMYVFDLGDGLTVRAKDNVFTREGLQLSVALVRDGEQLDDGVIGVPWADLRVDEDGFDGGPVIEAAARRWARAREEQE